MTETRFTPGPWRHAKGSNIGNLIEGPNGRADDGLHSNYGAIATVQDCCASYRAEDKDENCSANIALIAAAPALYAACQIALEYWYSDHPNDTVEGEEARGKIVAALAKARGEVA